MIRKRRALPTVLLGLLLPLVVAVRPASANESPCVGDDLVIPFEIKYQTRHVDIYADYVSVRLYQGLTLVDRYRIPITGRVDEVQIESGPSGLTFVTILDPIEIGMICGGDGAEWIVTASSVPAAEQPRLVVYAGGGRDEILGTPQADFIDGGEGDDEIYGLGGDDVLRGGDGDDVVLGYEGEDELSGDDGDDILIGDGFPPELGIPTASGIGKPQDLAVVDEADTMDGGAGFDVCDSALAGFPLPKSPDELAHCETSMLKP